MAAARAIAPSGHRCTPLRFLPYSTGCIPLRVVPFLLLTSQVASACGCSAGQYSIFSLQTSSALMPRSRGVHRFWCRLFLAWLERIAGAWLCSISR